MNSSEKERQLQNIQFDIITMWTWRVPVTLLVILVWSSVTWEGHAARLSADDRQGINIPILELRNPYEQIFVGHPVHVYMYHLMYKVPSLM